MSISVVESPEVGRTRRNEDQGTFVERFPILFEPAGRIQKAAKIIAVLRDFLGEQLQDSTLLEVGSSTGIMAGEFAHVVRQVIAFDMDHVALRAGAARAAADPVAAPRMVSLVGDGCKMPVAENSVDIVICNQVYEHVDNHTGLIDEIYRVLRPGGVCYFGIGTRHVLLEGHYKLPFLSWFTPKIADWYVKLRGADLIYDVTLLSYRNLRKLVRRFVVHDYTIDIICRPAAYAAEDVMKNKQFLSRIGRGILARLRPVLPVHVWLLQKPRAKENPWNRIVGE